MTYAQAEDTSRDVIVSIFLRGGADGLSLVVPYAEAAYYTLRPTIAIPRPDSTNRTAAVDLERLLRPAAGDGVAAAGVPGRAIC